MEPTEAAAQTPSYSPYLPAVALFLNTQGKKELAGLTLTQTFKKSLKGVVNY